MNSKVEISGIKVGHDQTLETLINEEALLFAKYLRDKRETWIPRIAVNFMYNYNNQYPRDYSDPAEARTYA